MKFLNKLFHLDEKNASIRKEIVGGLVIFISMCYILPVNASILSDMGMSQVGVFAMTAIVSAFVTLLMGILTNYPIVLSAGMAINAYIAYTVCIGLGFSWQKSMILLTIAGIIFFIISLTPIRKKIIEAIPRDIQYAISAALGAFICFVGLRNSGIIDFSPTTLVQLGNFADPSVLIAILMVVVCFGLMVSKVNWLSNFAIPIAILLAAIVGLIVSTIMYNTGSLYQEGTFWYYKILGSDIPAECHLPIVPWLTGEQFGMRGIEDVLFFGALTDQYDGAKFGNDLASIFTSPACYAAIFSLVFINLFNATATILAVGRPTGLIDEEGRMKDYRKVVMVDATGALICAPLGTSTVTCFAETSIGVSMGAKTGLAAVTAGLAFLLCSFIYPIFSIFTSGAVTAPALVCVGAMISINNFKEINLNDKVYAFTGFIIVIFSILCYSIASGIGIGLFVYIAMMLGSGRIKEVKPTIYVVGGLFLISFVLTTLMPLISGN